MSKTTAITTGKTITIKAGTIVTRDGIRTKRAADSTVTIRKIESARNGKTRVYWKSNGILASALV